MDYGRIVNNSFTLWYKDRDILKLAGLQILAGILFLILVAGALLLFFADLIPHNTVDPNDPIAALSLMNAFVAKIVPFLVVVVPLLLLYALVMIYIKLMMEVRALNILGFPASEMNAARLVQYILACIWTLVMAITSWYSRKLFYVFLAIVVLAVLGAAATLLSPALGAILLILAAVICVPYAFVVLRNSFRLGIFSSVFLLSDDGVLAPVRRTWELTSGKAIDVFVAGLITGVLLLIVSFVLFLPDTVIRVILGLMGLAVVSIFVSVIYRVLINPIMMAIGAFISPSIYLELTNDRQNPPASMPAPLSAAVRPTPPEKPAPPRRPAPRKAARKK